MTDEGKPTMRKQWQVMMLTRTGKALLAGPFDSDRLAYEERQRQAAEHEGFVYVEVISTPDEPTLELDADPRQHHGSTLLPDPRRRQTDPAKRQRRPKRWHGLSPGTYRRVHVR